MREPQILKFLDSGQRGSKFMTFLETLRKDEGPRFHFAHLVLPHEPWRYLPSGTLYPENEPVPGQTNPPGRGRGWGDDEWLVAQAYQRHLLQVKLVDNLVGVLLDRLERLDLFERSLIVITADHGTSFFPGMPERLTNETNVGSVAGIPLFVKLPFQKDGRVSDRPVEAIDILPTVTDVLDLSNPGRHLDGSSAFGPRRRERRSLGGTRIPRDGTHLAGAIERRSEVFGSDGGLFDLAPEGTAHLLGRRVEQLPIGSESALWADVARAGAYRDAVVEADTFPALLEGTLEGSTDTTLIAVAVDGKIVAVTRTYPSGDRAAFYAMLPPPAFGDPPHAVRLFAFDTYSGGLAPIASALDLAG